MAVNFVFFGRATHPCMLIISVRLRALHCRARRSVDACASRLADARLALALAMWHFAIAPVRID